ncbi:MAG: hypothetical protein ABEJ31_09155 [Haloarculaceae archaeon]
MAEFSDEQIGKRVVDQDGRPVGEVTDVRNGELWVRIDADADPDVIDDLDWDGVVNQETQRLNEHFVSTVRENTVRLNV